MALLSRLARISLLWKFALVNLIPILLLGLVLQHYLSSRVSERAITTRPGMRSRSRAPRSSASSQSTTCRYGLTQPEILALDETLDRPQNREHVQGNHRLESLAEGRTHRGGARSTAGCRCRTTSASR